MEKLIELSKHKKFLENVILSQEKKFHLNNKIYF